MKEKGEIYVSQLYHHLDNEVWDLAPNLHHKVQKHAPERILLFKCVEAEANLARTQKYFLHPERHYPEEAVQISQNGLRKIADVLVNKVPSEKHPEDANFAKVIAATISYVIKDYDQADQATSLVADEFTDLTRPVTSRGFWVALKRTLIQGLIARQRGDNQVARAIFFSAIDRALESLQDPSSCPALKRLALDVVLHSSVQYATDATPTAQEIDQGTVNFNSVQHEAQHPDQEHFTTLVRVLEQLRPHVKYTYNDFNPQVGCLLDHGIRDFYESVFYVYSVLVRAQDIHHQTNDASHQRLIPSLPEAPVMSMEFRLERLAFEQRRCARQLFECYSEPVDPKRLLSFFNQAMSNWQFINSSSLWRQPSLENIKFNMGRDLLQFLKGSQVNLYECVQVFRYLFTLLEHFTLFDDAMAYFSCYVDMFVRKRTSDPKTYNSLDIDHDKEAFSLATTAIRLLCRFSTPESATQAVRVGRMLHAWLGTCSPTVTMAKYGSYDYVEILPHVDDINGRKLCDAIGEREARASIRAVGLSYATFGKTLLEQHDRDRCLESAAELIQFSMSNLTQNPAPHSDYHGTIEAYFMLSMIALEQADLYSATTLFGHLRQLHNYIPDDLKRVPLLHLEVLLACSESQSMISADQDKPRFKSKITSLIRPEGSSLSTMGKVSECLDIHDKLNIIEAFRTVIILTGVDEGAQAAVNLCTELMLLYTQLFGSLKEEGVRPPLGPANPTDGPAKNSRGTIRSLVSRSGPKNKSIMEKSNNPLEPLPHNLPHDKAEPPVSHEKQPPEQDTRSPIEDTGAPTAEPRTLKRVDSIEEELSHLPQEDESFLPTIRFKDSCNFWYRTTALVRIWIFVSRIYATAQDFEQSKEALEKARNCFERLDKYTEPRSPYFSLLEIIHLGSWLHSSEYSELSSELHTAEGDYHFALAVGNTVFTPIFRPKPVTRSTTPNINSEQLLDDALSQYRQAVLDCPSFPLATVQLAEVLLRKGLMYRAYASLKTVINTEKGRSVVPVWQLLSMAASARGCPEEAEGAVRVAKRWEEVSSLRPYWITNTGGLALW